MLSLGQKPLEKVGEEPRKIRLGKHAGTDRVWPPRRGVYLGASVSQIGADPSEISRVLESIAEKVRRFGGRVETKTDAELLASFGLDDAMYEAPACAANAALAVQKAQGYADGSNSVTVQLTVRASTSGIREEADAPATDKDGDCLKGRRLGCLLSEQRPRPSLSLPTRHVCSTGNSS